MKITTPRAFLLATALLSGGTLLASTLPASAQPRPDRTPTASASTTARTVRPTTPTPARPITPVTTITPVSTYHPGNGNAYGHNKQSNGNAYGHNAQHGNAYGHISKATATPMVTTSRATVIPTVPARPTTPATTTVAPTTIPAPTTEATRPSMAVRAALRSQLHRTGKTNVRSNQSFDVTINGNTFNVYTTSRVPRGLSTGDTVRIYGEQMYNNDIRNASATIISNR